MNSDKLRTVKNLQSPRAAKGFLVELTNLGEQQADTERFWKRFKNFFPPSAFDFRERVATSLKPLLKSSSDSIAFDVERGVAENLAAHPEFATDLDKQPSAEEQMRLRQRNLIMLRDWLREAWTIADPRRKEWKVFELRQKFHQITVGSAEQWSEPPPASGMDYALRYLWRIADKARRCANPDCSIEPYFLVDRRGRRFCSDVCAQPAQREYKQHWWAEHREDISKKRKKEYRKTKSR
jgi:hypothetical protein